MIRVSLIITLLAPFVLAAPPLERVKPLEPAEALKAFAVRPGFRVELVAAEPLIASPVAIDFDEHGAIYVAEYPEYNQYANPQFKDKGHIRKLVSTKNDGKYDASTIFADNLDTPCGLIVANGGLYVGAPPDLWFLKDTNNDGVADVRRKVLTGFGRDPAGEGMLNSFRWTLEGKILIASGSAGGDLRKADDPNAKPQPIRRQNILFDPRKETFEFTSGGGQHGLALTDWGDQFVCDNAHPIQYIQYDQREIRNPHVEAPPAVVNIHPFGSKFKLGRISPPEPWRVLRTQMRSKKEFYGSDEGGEPFGFFTGATGITIYRGDAWPAEFRGDAFVGDVANNLVYRAKLARDGLHWKASRAESGPEFLASKDIWFRPVQFANGPDGCLWVVDMYRELIECASCLPGDALKGVDISGGINRGRIWRIVPEGFVAKPLPKLGGMSTAELVKLLDHPNAWHRETAVRLLGERYEGEAYQSLRALAGSSKNPMTRTLARYALCQHSAFSHQDAASALEEQDPNALIYALRIAHKHRWFGANARVRELARHEDIRVRYQVAHLMSVGKTSSADPNTTSETIVLAKLALQDLDEPLMHLAMLSGSKYVAGELLRFIHTERFQKDAKYRAFFGALTRQIGAAYSDSDGQFDLAVKTIENWQDSRKELREELARNLIARLPAKERSRLGNGIISKVMTDSISKAIADVVDSKLAPAKRAAAIRSLRIANWSEAGAALTGCLDIKQPPAVQTAALESLVGFDAPEVPALIVKAWSSLTPPVRATALETLLARPSGTKALFDAIEAKAIRPADLDPARVQILLTTLEEPLKSRAAKLLGASALSPRKDVIEKYRVALEKPGDVARGKLVFKNACSACHKLDGVGQDVGPDLSTARVRGVESILVSVLDPNREVLPKYYAYKATTDAGTTVTGLITADSATSLTIRRADGTSANITRASLEELKSTGLSAMPEGLETQVDAAAMADLLAYLMAAR